MAAAPSLFESAARRRKAATLAAWLHARGVTASDPADETVWATAAQATGTRPASRATRELAARLAAGTAPDPAGDPFAGIV